MLSGGLGFWSLVQSFIALALAVFEISCVWIGLRNPNSGFCGDIGSWEGTGNAS